MNASTWALFTGLILALLFENPYKELTKKWTQKLLAISVVGLGAGMNLSVIGQVGMQGVGYTVIGIATALLLGTWIGKGFQVEKDTSLLISVGTAICGGSAIAAVAPVIRAKDHEISVALGIVFVLNGIALLSFPAIGHVFSLSESQFGLWSALAIHDTSSVVGANLQYGPHALEVGTTVKLARALWIVPVAFMIGIWRSKTKGPGLKDSGLFRAKKPWFILGFLVAAAVVTFVPSLREIGHQIESFAKYLLVLTLFLIGTNLSRATLKQVGFKPFIQGALLWFVMASGTLIAVTQGWIKLF